LTQFRHTPDNAMARQVTCWYEGCAADLMSYCSDSNDCDALVLFYNGVGSNRTRPSAFFKTSSGSLDRHLNLASYLTLSPQAVLYVKKSSWTGNGSQGYIEVRECATMCSTTRSARLARAPVTCCAPSNEVAVWMCSTAVCGDRLRRL